MGVHKRAGSGAGKNHSERERRADYPKNGPAAVFYIISISQKRKEKRDRDKKGPASLQSQTPLFFIFSIPLLLYFSKSRKRTYTHTRPTVAVGPKFESRPPVPLSGPKQGDDARGSEIPPRSVSRPEKCSARESATFGRGLGMGVDLAPGFWSARLNGMGPPG